MFENNNFSQKNNFETNYDNGQSFFSNKKNIIIISVIILLVIIIIAGLFVFLNSKKEVSQEITETTETEAYRLNETLPSSTDKPTEDTIESTDIQGENLSFGDFYEANKQLIEEDEITYNIDDYSLPINIKIDVANYYDISRKIDLDDYIEDLNNNGFALLDNQFSTDNFFNTYQLLNDKDVPLLITSDFLIYYYQNILKNIYKEIESDVFYENLHDIITELYKTALARYEQKAQELKNENDLILEGERLEVAYFALALKLLEPKEEQINSEALNDSSKFNSSEAEKFYFDTPQYLQDQINQEFSLITTANQESKSPILLYQKDYSVFDVPDDYKANAKLNNFYLASKWLNSVFPLYYIGEYCPDCLLDEQDWRVNAVASFFIAKDFSDNQLIKNKWAAIYKVVSFFSGLRDDLNYLHYNESLQTLFGEDYDIANIFSNDNANQKQNFTDIQNKLSEYNFLEIQGGLDRNNDESKATLGMKFLTDSYWPNDYIFGQLTKENTGTTTEINKNINITSCNIDKVTYRCQGIGLDIINLVYQIPDDNLYFQENTNSQYYQDQILFLRNQLSDFNLDNWHNTNYWSTVDLANSFLNNDYSGKMPIFAQNKSWKNKNIYSSLGAWLNLQLPADVFNVPKDDNGNLLISEEYNEYSYIESDINLLQKLIINERMLSDILSNLEITEQSIEVEDYLNTLDYELNNLMAIVKKEVANEQLEETDYEYIHNFVSQYTAEPREKSSDLNSGKNRTYVLNANIDDINLLIIIYKLENRKYMAVGPVFDYEEE